MGSRPSIARVLLVGPALVVTLHSVEGGLTSVKALTNDGRFLIGDTVDGET